MIFKLLLIPTILLAAYAFYLDAQIKASFEGNKWAVPAQIFARPMILRKGEEVTRTEVIDELKLLGYRRVGKASRSGEFSVSKTSISFYRRGFQFPDGYEPMRRITLTWSGPQLSRIADKDLPAGIDQVRLEPWLVTRLVSSSHEDRMLLSLDDVPRLLPVALTLVEDKNFYRHHGVAPLSILRALLANIAAGRTVQGGSTLTQQLVKNLYLSREQTLVRKAKEAIMAVIIDARYSKSEILQAYLNEVFLAQNGSEAVHGFGLASHFFFDRPVNELNGPEIATLVAMIKGPSYYNPRRFPERAIERRNLVLRVLFEANEITKAEYENWVDSPLGIASGASLASGKHPAFMDKVQRELKTILAEPNIRESGLKVFTTLDIYAQRRAEKALVDGLKQVSTDKRPELQGAMLVSDISTGGIRAIVGAKETQYKGFNRALDATRQVGSLIKPAVYLTALENPGVYNLATVLDDKPLTIEDTEGKPWSPKNADKKYRGQVHLIDGLVKSLNIPTVNLGMELGIDNIRQTIEQLGVKRTLPTVPSLTLGAVSLSPLEVNQMYQTIANEGVYTPIHTVDAVVSPNHRLLWQRAEYDSQRADPSAVYLLNYALYKVTTQGTAKWLGKRFKAVNMAGKTGTTDDNRDAWFSGFDRNYVTTVWVGNDNNQSTGLSGASGALPIFINYQSLQEPKSLSRRFPEGLGIVHFEASTGRVLPPGCAGSLSYPAVLDALPPALPTCDGKPVPKVPEEQKKPWWKRIFG